MKYFLLTAFSFLLYTNHSSANSEVQNDCVSCELDVANTVVKSSPNSKPIDKKIVKRVCRFLEMTKFDRVMDTLEKNNLSLVDDYMRIDCTRVNRDGPTLMHLLLKGESSLVRTAIKLAKELVKAKKENPNLDTGNFFNMKEFYLSVPLTVVGIIDAQIEQARQYNLNYDDLKELRNLLITKLDAKL